MAMAEDFRRALEAGELLQRPWGHGDYYAVEYWPALYSLLAGAVAWLTGMGVQESCVALSATCGVLVIVPAALLARDLFGERAGLVAGLLVALHPTLGRVSTIPRTEALYVLLYTTAVLFTARALLRSRGARLWAPLAGAAWGLAYLARFEGVVGAGLALILTALRGWSTRRPAGPLLVLLGFLVVSGPYLAYLHRLSAGPALAPPAKSKYDSLEMVWIVEQGLTRFREFVYEYGPPGSLWPEALEEAAPERVGARLPALFRAWWFHLPRFGRELLLVYPPLTAGFFLLAAWWGRRDPRVRLLLWFTAPLAVYEVLAFWDPHGRYYVFAAPLVLTTVAAWATEPEAGEEGPLWIVSRPVLLLLLAALSWQVPSASHPDDFLPLRFTRVTLQDLLPPATPCSLLLTAVAAASLLALRRAHRWSPGLAVATLALALLALAGEALRWGGWPASPAPLAQVLTAPGFSQYRHALLGVAFLGVLAELAAASRAPWQACSRLVLGTLVALSLHDQAVTLQQNVQRARTHEHPRLLAAVPDSREAVLMSEDPMDGWQAGVRWTPLVPPSRWHRLDQELARRQPDYLLLDLKSLGPEPERAWRAVQALQDSGRLVLVESVRAALDPDDPPPASWLFRVFPPGREIRPGSPLPPAP